MNTLIAIIVFIAFYALINTSKKAVLRKDSVSLYFQKNKKMSNIAGIVLLVSAFIVSISFKGITSGILFTILVLSVVASLVILLNPLSKEINYKTVILFFSICIILEILSQ